MAQREQERDDARRECHPRAWGSTRREGRGRQVADQEGIGGEKGHGVPRGGLAGDARHHQQAQQPEAEEGRQAARCGSVPIGLAGCGAHRQREGCEQAKRHGQQQPAVHSGLLAPGLRHQEAPRVVGGGAQPPQPARERRRSRVPSHAAEHGRAQSEEAHEGGCGEHAQAQGATRSFPGASVRGQEPLGTGHQRERDGARLLGGGREQHEERAERQSAGWAARPERLHDQGPDDEEREEHVGPARRNRDRLELQRMEGEDERGDAGPPAGAEPASGQDEHGDHPRQEDDQVGQVVAERSKPPHGVVQREDEIRQRAVEVPSRVAPVHQLLAEAPQQVSEVVDPARGDGGVAVPSHQLEIEHEAMGEERRDERKGEAGGIPVVGLHARSV